MASIGQVSWALNVSEDTLRRWEREGKINPPDRRPTGMRDYTDEQIKEIMKFLESKDNGDNGRPKRTLNLPRI